MLSYREEDYLPTIQIASPLTLKERLLRLKSEGPGKHEQYRGLLSRLKRRGQRKTYRLKGYTSAAAVEELRRRQYSRRRRYKLIFIIALIFILLMLFVWLDPLPKLQELRSIIGF